jgi:PAS domain S-box-containing protein
MAEQDSASTGKKIFKKETAFHSLPLTDALKTLTPHDHLCLVYETEEEWRSAAITFIALGLQRNEKCIYVVDTHTAGQICSYLSEEGVDVEPATTSGQLVILHETEAYTRDGVFDPDKMIALLIEETEKALSEGYTALRITGEMSWALRGHPGSEALLEYEAKLNRDLFPDYPCLAICQYYRKLFDPKILRYVVMTHPFMVRNNCIYHNPYYIPPDEFLGQKRNHYELEHWLESLEHQSLVAEIIRRSEELEALYKISSTIAQSLDLKAVLNVALEKTLEVLNAEGGIIYILDEYSQMYTPTVSYGFSQNILEKATEFKKGEGLSGYAVQTGNPVLVSDMATNSWNISPVYDAEGWQSLVSVPLKAEGALKGVLTISSRTRARFRQGDLNLLASIGNQIGVAIENAELYEAKQQELKERRRAEEALQESEKKYRDLVENIGSIIYVCDTQGVLTYVNPVVEPLIGYHPSEVTGRSFTEFLYEEDVNPGQAAFRSIMAGHTHQGEYRLVAKSGHVCWVNASGRPIHENGCIIGVQGVVTDITARKRAEEELMQLSTAVKISNDSIVITDMEGCITYVNEATLKLYRTHTREDLIGKNIIEIVIPEDRKKVAAAIEEVREKGFVENWEYGLIVEDGSHIMVETSMVLMETAAGTPKGCVGITRDITERKRAEREIKRKLMRYDLEEGNMYLVKESEPLTSAEAFRDLLNVGYPGLAISRTPKREFKDTFEQEFDYFWVAEKGDEVFIPPELKKIAEKIEALAKATAIFIDRLDYLISKTSFREILSFVYNLREIAYLKDHIVILCVDPSTMNQQELIQIEKEAAKVEPLYKTRLPEKLIAVLKVVYEQNTKGVTPSYTTIGQKIGASKPTTRKRIRMLINYGYLEETQKGRTKIVDLTEKGRTLFLK